jgi:hypothetical protein
MDKYFDKATMPVAGILLGYAIAHVVCQIFLVDLVFKPFSFNIGKTWKTNIDANELIAIILLGAVIRFVFRGDEGKFRLFTLAGAALWVFVAVVK